MLNKQTINENVNQIFEFNNANNALIEKQLIDSLEESADVTLKYNYDLGEIMGLNPEVMAQMTKDTVNNFVNLANKDFSLLAKKYGLVCKNLVENPEERTNYWEDKGKKLIK